MKSKAANKLIEHLNYLRKMMEIQLPLIILRKLQHN